MESMDDTAEWELMNGGRRPGTAAAVAEVHLLEAISGYIHAASSSVRNKLTKRYAIKKESGLTGNPFVVLEQIGSHLGVDRHGCLPWTPETEDFPMLHYRERCLLIGLNRVYELATELINDERFAVLEHEMQCLLTYLSRILDPELMKDFGQFSLQNAPPTFEERKQQVLKRLKKNEELRIHCREFRSNLSNM